VWALKIATQPKDKAFVFVEERSPWMTLFDAWVEDREECNRRAQLRCPRQFIGHYPYLTIQTLKLPNVKIEKRALIWPRLEDEAGMPLNVA
jgi:hypothetical protein